MKLSAFIKEHSADILAEWDASARLIAPASSHMTSQALRDHAEPILAAIALDIDTFQTAEEEREKSHGQAPDEATRTAASIHGTLRGFSGSWPRMARKRSRVWPGHGQAPAAQRGDHDRRPGNGTGTRRHHRGPVR